MPERVGPSRHPVRRYAGHAAWSALLVLPALSACTTSSANHVGLFSATEAVIALINDDLFLGQQTGYANGNSRIYLASTTHAQVTCAGAFFITGSAAGHADIHCTDGLAASIAFTHSFLGSLSGYGYAQTARGSVSYTYGMTPGEAVKYLKFAPGTQLDLAGPIPRIRRDPPDAVQ